MGTRSLVTFIDEWDGKEICAVYRQYDGSPDGRGYELADFLEGYTIGNGIQYGVDDQPDVKYANGMRELAALWIMHEKSQNLSGNVYLHRPDTRNVGEEWIYEVSKSPDGKPSVEVTDVYGECKFT